MAAEVVHELDHREHARTRSYTVRARAVAAIAPLAIVAGLAWAVAQPYRITLLHPHGQGFWWLVSEPPLFVILVGIVFRLVVAPGLLRDLEEAER
jgi:ABC-type amino acid transport system permease subunit